MEAEKIVGVLGGMGPEATIEFMHRLVNKNKAISDSGHIHCIVDQNSKVPNRIRSINGEGPSSGPVLADMAKRLEAYGVDMLCMPCNTAHYYLADIQEASSLPFVDMITCTVEHLIKTNPDEKVVGLLATNSTIQTDIFKRKLEAYGLEEANPCPELQERVNAVIRAVKQGHKGEESINTLKGIIADFRKSGVNVLIAACTELSVICPKDDPAIIDALDCLADKVVLLVKGNT